MENDEPLPAPRPRRVVPISRLIESILPQPQDTPALTRSSSMLERRMAGVSLLDVPEDIMQRVQSPPMSPMPPQWIHEQREGGPERGDPFPMEHRSPNISVVGAGAFRIVRKKERSASEVRITVDEFRQKTPRHVP